MPCENWEFSTISLKEAGGLNTSNNFSKGLKVCSMPSFPCITICLHPRSPYEEKQEKLFQEVMSSKQFYLSTKKSFSKQTTTIFYSILIYSPENQWLNLMDKLMQGKTTKTKTKNIKKGLKIYYSLSMLWSYSFDSDNQFCTLQYFCSVLFFPWVRGLFSWFHIVYY